jgi:hypothetical protein
MSPTTEGDPSALVRVELFFPHPPVPTMARQNATAAAILILMKSIPLGRSTLQPGFHAAVD